VRIAAMNTYAWCGRVTLSETDFHNAACHFL